QTRGARIRLLVEYAERQRLLDRLLEAVRAANPNAYAEFEPRLRAAEPPASVPPPPPPPPPPQGIRSPAAQFSYTELARAPQALPEVTAAGLKLPADAADRAEAVTGLKNFLLKNLGTEPLPVPIRAVRQEVVRAIRALAVHPLGQSFRDAEL